MANYTRGGILDRNLALEFVRVTEAAALNSAKLMGRGDEKAADHDDLSPEAGGAVNARATPSRDH